MFYQGEDGIGDLVRSRGVGEVYKGQAIKASLLPEPAVPAVPSDEASTSRMPPSVVAPVLSAIEGKVEKIEVHGRWYTLIEFAQKFCRLHPDPSGKTCK